MAKLLLAQQQGEKGINFIKTHYHFLESPGQATQFSTDLRNLLESSSLITPEMSM